MVGAVVNEQQDEEGKESGLHTNFIEYKDKTLALHFVSVPLAIACIAVW